MLAHRFSRLPQRPAARFGAAALLASVVVLPACERMPLLAPSGTSMTLTTSAAVLSANGVAEITAVLVEGGQGTGTGQQAGTVSAGTGTPVHNGTVVTFTTTLGRLEPSQAKTEGGRATVKLHGDGASGTATITAFSGSARQTLQVTIARTALTITPPASASVSVPANFVLNVTSTGGTGVSPAVSNVVVDFGDGGTAAVGTLAPSTSGTAVAYLFGTTGLHKVTVSGTDSDGARLEAATQVAVNNTLQASGSAAPTSVALGLLVTFTVTVSPTGASIDRYEWDFGEGSVVATSTASLSYIFSTKGPKTVTVRVVPAKGPAMTVVIQCQIT